MIVKKCDRCGMVYEKEGTAQCFGKCLHGVSVHVSTDGLRRTEILDLCPDCLASIGKWLSELHPSECHKSA